MESRYNIDSDNKKEERVMEWRGKKKNEKKPRLKSVWSGDLTRQSKPSLMKNS